MSEPKYPRIRVRLVGQDGNAFSILARVARAMRRHSLPKSEVDAFYAEATRGDYDHLLATVVRWVDTD